MPSTETFAMEDTVALAVFGPLLSLDRAGVIDPHTSGPGPSPGAGGSPSPWQGRP